MKRFLILTTILLFACSSDDSSDNSNQTFFERYDGVVWELDTELTDYPFSEDFIARLQLINGDEIYEKWYEYDIYDTYCEIDPLTYMNDTNTNYHSYRELIETGSDYFKIRNTEEDGIVNGVTIVRTHIVTITATNNGNNLIFEYGEVTDNVGTEYSSESPTYLFRTTLTDPCE
ncbi:MAG: hypothetical protein ACON5K_02425 [Bacteroidia bacterium]